MSIAHPIGYPTPNPMHNPKGYPNRGRIARPVSARIDPSYTRETSHHGVAYVTRAAAAPAPVEPRDDMMTALEVLEGIDLDVEVPCEGCPDGLRADYMVKGKCAVSGDWHVAGVCRSCWAEFGEPDVRFKCKCGAQHKRDEIMRIVEVLR